MAERTWEYLLPTGERLEARLDVESDVESVYLGPRLVSRSTGRKSGGHVVEIMHGEAAGPFRGGSAARVVFEASPPRCDVTVDDRPLEATVVPPVAQPKEVPPDAVVVVAPRAITKRLVAALVIVAVAGTASVWRARQQYALDSIGALPLRGTALSPNGMLRVHYSPDFDVSARSQGTTNYVTLTRRDHPGGALLVNVPHASATSSEALELQLGTDPQLPSWARARSLSEHATTDRCFEKTAITMLRTIEIDDRRFHVWSCTFVRGEQGYRFLAYAPEFADRDMAVLRRVVLATELL